MFIIILEMYIYIYIYTFNYFLLTENVTSFWKILFKHQSTLNLKFKLNNQLIAPWSFFSLEVITLCVQMCK